MKKDTIYVGIFWVVLTAAGFFLASRFNIFPMVASEEAAHLDQAFTFLLKMAVPVASTVLAFLIYSVLRFRADEEVPGEGAAPIRGNTLVSVGWLLVTTGMAVFIVFNPGLEGLRFLESNPNADLVVEIEAEQWHWNVTYPEQDLSYQRATHIALPVDSRVKFEITSVDVIHSFWIPAFRLKQDAVPGRTTSMYVTPTQTGSTEEDVNLRVQCAELCGTGHPRMRMDVLVLEPEEFEHWVEEVKMELSGEGSGMEMDMEMEE